MLLHFVTGAKVNDLKLFLNLGIKSSTEVNAGEDDLIAILQVNECMYYVCCMIVHTYTCLRYLLIELTYRHV